MAPNKQIWGAWLSWGSAYELEEETNPPAVKDRRGPPYGCLCMPGVCVYICMCVSVCVCVVFGVSCVVCGVWCVVCGVWCVVCGVWCVCVCVCVYAANPPAPPRCCGMLFGSGFGGGLGSVYGRLRVGGLIWDACWEPGPPRGVVVGLASCLV